MTNENWDPAVGMQQDPNQNKDNKSILITIALLLAALIGFPTIMISIFNRERSSRDGEFAYTKTLENLITYKDKKVWTWCGRKTVSSFFFLLSFKVSI